MPAYTARARGDVVKGFWDDFFGPLPDGTIIQGCVLNIALDLPYEAAGKGYALRSAIALTMFFVEQ